MTLYSYIEENASPEVAIEDGRVEIIGIFHGGRDYERASQPAEPDEQGVALYLGESDPYF